jgi:probable addiction module antidote protein
MSKKVNARPYRDTLLAALADPEDASSYLNAAIEDSPEAFRIAVLNVIQTRQVAQVAREAKVTREHLYRSFSAKGNPTLDTLYSVLHALHLRMEFAPASKPEQESRYEIATGYVTNVVVLHSNLSYQQSGAIDFLISPNPVGGGAEKGPIITDFFNKIYAIESKTSIPPYREQSLVNPVLAQTFSRLDQSGSYGLSASFFAGAQC